MLHEYFKESLSWYKSWHNHPRHQHTHWFGLFLVILLATTFLSVQLVYLYIEEGVVSAQAQTQTDLPASEVPLLMAYYITDGTYKNEVKDYVNAFFTDGDINDPATIGQSIRDIVGFGQGHKIILWGGSPAGWADAELAVAKDYWDDVAWVYLDDESSWSKERTEQEIDNYKAKVAALGLPQKPIGISYTYGQFYNNSGWNAGNLDYIGFEAYPDVESQNDPNLAAWIDARTDDIKRFVRKPTFMIIQGYDRNFTWTNLQTLQQIQTSPYAHVANDPNMVAILIFSYGRGGGTRALGPCISTEHKRLWGAISRTAQPASIPCNVNPATGGIQFPQILSSWEPPQTRNGWWAELSPDTRYVAYGNWGESWVTDLQTGQYWNFQPMVASDMNPGSRCLGGHWILPNKLTFPCELATPEGNDAPGRLGFYRYEVNVGEWIPRRTADDPQLVVGGGSNFAWQAQDGHWASYAPFRIAKDNQIIVSGNAEDTGGLGRGLSGSLIATACTNANESICIWDDNVLVLDDYPTPFGFFDLRLGLGDYVAYGGRGPVRGFCLSDQKDIDLKVGPPGSAEIPDQIFEVNGSPWVISASWNVGPMYFYLHPWGERDSIVLNIEAVNTSTVYKNGIFTIAYHDAVGRMKVITVPDNAPRNDLSGGLPPETCGISSATPRPLAVCESIPGYMILCDLSPVIAEPGQNVQISGSELPTNVILTNVETGLTREILGSVNADKTLLTLGVPSDMPEGEYSVTVQGNINQGDGSMKFQASTTTSRLSVRFNAVVNPLSLTDSASTLSLPVATDFQDLINNLITYSFLLVGMAVFIVFLRAGFLWLTSAANPGNISTAKGMMSNAVIGLVLLASAYVILNTINPELVGGKLDLKQLGTPSTGTQAVITQPTCDNGFCSNNSGLACSEDTDCNAVCISNACTNGTVGSCTLDTDCQTGSRFIAQDETEAAQAFAAGCGRVPGIGYQDFIALDCPTSAIALAVDPVFQAQDFDANNQIGATSVQNTGNTGQGRRIVILDTGYNYTHPELRSSYIGGWDFVNGDSDPMDDQIGGTGAPGHGSHVAGIITADGIDSRAKGIAPDAQIIAGKILDARGQGSYSAIVTGIYWAINGPDGIIGTADDFRPDAINISVGGGNFPNICDNNDATTRQMAQAIQYARDNGAIVVAAAGNTNRNGVTLPGCVDASLTVGALNASDALASFSGVGAGVDVTAPGVNIYSSLLGNNLGLKSGTSMATPLVSGLIALIKSANPTYTVDDIEQTIFATAIDLGQTGKDSLFGWGAVSAGPRSTVSPTPTVSPSPTPSPTPTPLPCPGGCARIAANPVSCTYGANPANPNCNVNISYSITNIPVANLKIKKVDSTGSSQTWATVNATTGSQTETSPRAGTITYRIVNDSTQAILASVNVRTYYRGTLTSPWLACRLGISGANPSCNVALDYNILGNGNDTFTVFKDGNFWRNLTGLSGTLSDPNPGTGTKTYTIRTRDGGYQISRLVIRIDPARSLSNRLIAQITPTSAKVGDQITIRGNNLGNQLEVARRYFTVQLHDRNRVRHTTIGTLDPSNTSGTWTVDIPPSMLTSLPADFTIRVGPTLNLNDVSNEINLRIIP